VYRFAVRQRLSARLAFSPAGELLYTHDGRAIGKSNVLTLIDPATGRVRWTLPLKETHAAGIAFSPDGATLAVGGDDGTLVLYEAAVGRRRHAFRGHGRAVDGVAFTPDGALLAASSVDAPAFVWDVYGTQGDQPGPEKWSAEQAQQLWQDLAAPGTEAAFLAVRRLVQHPAAALPLLRERLRPAEPVAEGHLKKLLRDLDSDDFQARQGAYAELEKLLDRVEFRLRAALKAAVPLEVQRRLDTLLAQLDPATPDRLRRGRALEALEQMASPDAVALLEALAAGEPGARLTREAAAALDRVRRRD
jgi:hypothetical protein